jgi:hypothetical protein
MKKETSKKKVDWRAIRISNRRVNSLQKYWDAFPGLKEEIFKKPKSENDYALRRKSLNRSLLNNIDVSMLILRTVHKIEELKESWYTRFVVNAKDVDLENEPERIMNEVKAIYENVPLADTSNVGLLLNDIWKVMKKDIVILQEKGIQGVKQFKSFRMDYAHELGIDTPTTYQIDKFVDLLSILDTRTKDIPEKQEIDELLEKHIKTVKEKEKNELKEFEEKMDGYMEKVTEEKLEKYIREEWLDLLRMTVIAPLYNVFDELYEKYEKWTGIELEYDSF